MEIAQVEGLQPNSLYRFRIRSAYRLYPLSKTGYHEGSCQTGALAPEPPRLMEATILNHTAARLCYRIEAWPEVPGPNPHATRFTLKDVNSTRFLTNNDPSFALCHLRFNATYHLKMTANNSGGESSPSAVLVIVTPPPPPRNLEISTSITADNQVRFQINAELGCLAQRYCLRISTERTALLDENVCDMEVEDHTQLVLFTRPLSDPIELDPGLHYLHASVESPCDDQLFFGTANAVYQLGL